MKLQILLALLLIPLLLFFFGCGTGAITQDIAFVFDQTEVYFMHPTFEEFRRVSAVTRNEFNGERTRITQITESGFNTVMQFEVVAIKNKWFDNEVDRRNELKSYFDSVEAAFITADSGRRERSASAVWQTLSAELNRLSTSSTDRKVLVVSSDLMELSSMGDFYDAHQFSELTSSPNSVVKRFEAAFPVPDLHSLNLTVYLIYKPQSRADSERFTVVSSFYKRLFEEHGAKVIVAANLVPIN
jgi:hypothetical protein